MDEDYFGDVVEPQGAEEEEEDLANDLTFGDTSDIVAGAPDSDTAWKPGHELLTQRLEIEKQELQRRSTQGSGAPGGTPAARVAEPHALQVDYQRALRQAFVDQGSVPKPATASDAVPGGALQQHSGGPNGNRQQVPQPSLPNVQPPQHTAAAPRQTMQHMQAPNGAHGRQSYPSMGQMPVPQTSFEAFEVSFKQRVMYFQQHFDVQRRQLHTEKQQLLTMQQLPENQPLLRQICEQLDRNRKQLEGHMATHEQAMRHLMQERYQQHMMLQQQSHNIQRSLHPLANGVASSPAALQHVPGVQQVSGLPQAPGGPQHSGVPQHPGIPQHPGAPLVRGVPPIASVPQVAGVQDLRGVANISGVPQAHPYAGSRAAFGDGLAASYAAAGVSNGTKELGDQHGPPHAPAGRQNQGRAPVSRPFPNTMPNAAMSLEDVERSLRARDPQSGQAPRPQHSTGGPREQPRKPSNASKKDFNKPKSNPASRGGRRRLESMTDRDIGLVLRMHLRQLDSSVPYVHEFYSFAVGEKRTHGNVDPFERLAGIVGGMSGHSGKGHNRNGPKGARPRSAGDPPDGEEGGPASAVSHTQGNMSTLATALGTLQVWNPKAPRRVVDFGAVSDTGGANNPASAGGDMRDADANSSGKLLREDDRIVVRAAVENGYDIITSIHDVARRKSSAPVDPLVRSLFDLLCLPSCVNRPDQSKEDAFFVRMCGFSKGRTFVTRAFWLFRPVQKKRVSVCVMRNLLYMLQGESANPTEVGVNQEFWRTVCNFVGDASNDAQWALDCLDGFLFGHSQSMASVSGVLESQTGAYLVATCLQRLLGNRTSGLYSEDTLLHVEQSMAKMCKCATSVLKDVFIGTKSTDTVWQVVAILDALAPPDNQVELRGTLKLLLDEGHAPPPPAA